MEDEQRQILRSYLTSPKVSETERAAVKAELTSPHALQRMVAIVLGVHSIIPNGDLKTAKQAEAFVLDHMDMYTRRALTTDQAAFAMCALDDREYMDIGSNNKAYRYTLTLNEDAAKVVKQTADDCFPMTELRLRFVNFEKIKKTFKWVAGKLLKEPFIFPLPPEGGEDLALKGYAIMGVTPPEKRPTFAGLMDMESKKSQPRQPTLFTCPYNELAGLRPDGKKKRRRRVVDHTA